MEAGMKFLNRRGAEAQRNRGESVIKFEPRMNADGRGYLLKDNRRLSVFIGGFLLLPAALLFFANTTHADESFTYSPEYCEFSVTFPSEPYTARRCEDGGDDSCYNLVSYTQTYNLDSTVNVRVICNPIAAGVQQKYNEEVSKATVRAMAKRNALSNYSVNYRAEGGFRQAGLVGEGESGRTPMIYIAQLWVGESSVMSVEAELIGEAAEEPDTLFSDIMRSVGPKSLDESEKASAEQEAPPP